MSARLGPLAEGAAIAGARITAIAWRGDAAHLTLEVAGATVDLVLAATAVPPGPFRGLPALTYRPTALPFAQFAAAGAAVAAALAPHWPGCLARDWRDALAGLGDDVDAALPLGEVLPAAAAARVACVAPWTRLEYGQRAQYGPCCADFQAAPALGHGPPLSLWRSAAMRGFRRALASAPPPSTCRTDCPRLAARSDTLASIVLRGGPPAYRANQRAVIEAILAGDDDPATTPLELVCSATRSCNYDCLMCSHGATGTLADELPVEFYQGLAPILPGLGALEVLGGEPLASPVLRRVLAGPILRGAPQLEVALTTNGSYLTADALDRFRSVRLGHVTVSLNAATAATYQRVNRGLPWARIRANTAALLAAHHARRSPRAITYSMVILRANLDEIEAFAALAAADGVAVRYMLPIGDRNRQSFLGEPALVRAVAAALARVAADLRARGRVVEAARVDGEVAVLGALPRGGRLPVLPGPP
ncbi:MAG: radical SAM protein [Kofleriaceae bacterium]